jgi:predicted GNAT family acetyltransferase
LVVISQTDAVQVELSSNARSFSLRAGAFLSGDPFSTNVIGVQLRRVLDAPDQAGEQDLWITVSEGGSLVGAAMHTPPFSLFLPRLPPGVAGEIAAALHSAGRVVTGVNGEADAVNEFADAFGRLSGLASVVETRMRLYRLIELRPPTTRGEARLALPGDRGLVEQWLESFRDEADPTSPAEAGAIAERRIAASEMWLWTADGELVSLAGHSRPAGGVARVGPVYTPPEHRGHGFGSAVTAKASAAAIERGAAHVVLYADAANATSNAIYQALGYVKDHEAVHRKFR